MKERMFDSRSSDAKPMHRASYQDGCGTIHALGTGNIMLYGRGPEWMQVIGAPYSCPSVFALVVPKGDAVQARSRRREGVGGWIHELPQGTLEDCASRECDCIARRWQLNEPVRFELDALDHELSDVSAPFPNATAAWLLVVRSTAAIYNDYPLGNRTYMLIVADGGCEAVKTQNGLFLTLKESGTMYVMGSQNYKECYAGMRKNAAMSFDVLREAADEEDKVFLSRIAECRTKLREHRLRERVLAASEEAALMIRAQQHLGGGVQAGHNYHLAYVRDQYGVSRGLIAAGALNEARVILEFYREIFAKWGFIANAQAMGVDGIFHVHENDEVEITGYLLLQAADYLKATGDEAFFRSLLPMLKWALQVQLKWLHRDMLPFNGDETYVAGWIVPRTLLEHGSFEATLLLITGGQRFISLCEEFGCKEEWMDDVTSCLERVSANFDTNFKRGENYVTNSLGRLEGLDYPPIKHGVCTGGDNFGWMHHQSEGVYQCARCMGIKHVEPCREEYQLKSTLMMAPFIASDQLDMEYLGRQVDGFLETYRVSGVLPSRPDGDRCCGYDFGLLLFAAAKTGRNADDVLEDMLNLQDEAGAWSEYFRGDVPEQTRCRPWESGMNIAGAMCYLAR